MGRVFLSYSRKDADVAQAVAEAIAAAGHEVWWDRHLPGGSRYAVEIDRALQDAEAVVVLWSHSAIASSWVQDEAVEGRDSGRLIPVMLDGSKPPLGFRQFQCVDLSDGLTQRLDNLLSAIAAIAGQADVAATDDKSARLATPRKASICVLPFANMSGDTEQEYFSDGISEDIITDLTKVSSLSVTARNTAFTFKGHAVDVANVARQLGVSHILEGSVRKAGSWVRITAQLIDGAAGDHVWAERYDRDLTDIFAIQDEISKAIVTALKIKLLPAEKGAIEQRHTTSAEAYDLYLMARQYWISGNYGDRRRMETVVRICRRAIEIDPDYALAWALMALAQADWHSRDSQSEEDGMDAAERALALNPGLAEAHCVKAVCLADRGAADEAQIEIALALRLDPESWVVNKEAGRLLLRQGQAAEAIPYLAKATTLMDDDYQAAGLLLVCSNAVGDVDGARSAAVLAMERAERALAVDQNNGVAIGYLAYGLAFLGETERARHWAARALLIDPENLTLRYNLACSMVVNLHDPEAALDMLGPYFAKVGRSMVEYAATDPDMNAVRDDPRFQEMINDARLRFSARAPG